MAGHSGHDAFRTLHLVRHAHAGDPEGWQGPDAARPLSDLGHAQAAQLGVFMARSGIRPDHVISSPKVRAQQTAQAIVDALGMSLLIDERLADGPELDELDELLGELGGREAMIVGHDPSLSSLLDELLGAAGQEMRKGTLATFRVRRPLLSGQGRLRWLIPPELLSRPDPRPAG